MDELKKAICVLVQIVVSVPVGFKVPRYLWKAHWVVGGLLTCPTGALLLLCGFALARLSPSTWWVAGVAAIVGLLAGAATIPSAYCGLYVLFFWPLALIGGLFGFLWPDSFKDERAENEVAALNDGDPPKENFLGIRTRF